MRAHAAFFSFKASVRADHHRRQASASSRASTERAPTRFSPGTSPGSSSSGSPRRSLKALFYTPCFYFLGQLRLDATAYLAAAFATGEMGFAGSAVAMLITTLMPGLVFNYLVS